MADTNTDVAGSPAEGQPASNTVPEGAAAEAAYRDKSREDIISMHKELEKKLSEQGNEVGQLRDFVGRVGVFFKVDGDQVTLNDEMVKRYAETQGWIQPEPSIKDDYSAVPKATNGDGSVFEPEEQKTIRDLIRNEIKEAFKDSVEPLSKRFNQSQYDQWIERVGSLYKDFDSYRPKIAEFVNKTGYQVNSAEDLKKAYIAVKALSGDMVDKNETQAHISELQRTLQTLKPGAGQPIRPISEVSNAELLGLETADSPQKKAFEVLTGKPYYKT